MPPTATSSRSSSTSIQTSFFPFTTPWAAPETCSTQYIRIHHTDKADTYMVFNSEARVYNTTLPCNPPEVYTSFMKDLYKTTGYMVFSLEPFNYPGDWASVAGTVKKFGGGGSSTYAACCPSEYTANISPNTLGTLDVSCVSYIQTATNITYVDAVNTNNPITTTYLSSGYRVLAQLVSGWNIGPASTAASSTMTTTASPFSGLTTSNPDSGLSARDAIIGEENYSDGLSMGTKAGIAIGILAFVAAIVRVMVIAWRKNQKEKEKEEADKRLKDSGGKGQGKDQGAGQGQDVTELDGSDTLRSGPQELDGINRVEMFGGYQGAERPNATSSRVAEDRAGGMVYELDADTASTREFFNAVK